MNFKKFKKEEKKVIETPLASLKETNLYSNGKMFFKVNGVEKLSYKEKDYKHYLRARSIQEKRKSFILIKN